MSYQDLYKYCQTLTPKVSRNDVRDQILALTKTDRVSVMKTELDTNICRGFYLSAKNKDHPIVKQFGSDVIVLARSLNECWERFVYVKELMHLFDDSKEATDTGVLFETLLGELAGPSINRSSQYLSEIECIIRGIDSSVNSKKGVFAWGTGGALAPKKWQQLRTGRNR